MSEQQRTGIFSSIQESYNNPDAQKYAREAAEYYLSLKINEAIRDGRRYIVQHLPSDERRDGESIFIGGRFGIRMSAIIALADPNDCKVGEHVIRDAPPVHGLMVFRIEDHGLVRRVR